MPFFQLVNQHTLGITGGLARGFLETLLDDLLGTVI